MYWLMIILGLFFTLFSGSVLAYVSVATMVGPWMAPSIAAMASLVLKSFRCQDAVKNTTVIQAIGSVGGSIATGIGFAFPTLFFLDSKTFYQLLEEPRFFCLLVGLLCFVAGAFGIVLGTLFATQFLDNKKLPFPVSQMTYSVIGAQNNRKQAGGIFGGITLGALFALMRDGIGRVGGFLPKSFSLFPSILGGEFVIMFWPTIWAIGFMSGVNLIAPLALGLLSKYFIIYPLHNHALYLPFQLFEPMNLVSFVVAFCSGIVVCEVAIGIGKSGKGGWMWLSGALHNSGKHLRSIRSLLAHVGMRSKKIETIVLVASVVGCAHCLLTWLKFPFMAQVVFLGMSVLATYQICLIGGNIGLIHYGRFSTYVLVPMFLLFKLSALQLTVVCTFFNICAAVASDLLFDLKTGDLAQVSRRRMWLAQWVGLIATAVTIGFIFYLLFTNMQIGSPDFFAHRSQSKALLLQALHFDFRVVFLGVLYGMVVKSVGLSPTMVFGGIIMPNSISIGLMIGALGTLLVRRKEDYLPLCAGVFTSESLLILAGITAKFW